MSDAYIFGEIVKNFEPDVSTLSDVIARSREKKIKLAAAPLCAILETLDAVSRAWADKDYPLRRVAWDYLKERTGYSDEMLEMGFQTVSCICSKPFLKMRLRCELNCEHSFEKLDAPAYDKKSGGLLKLNPLGSVLHVSASNVFISAVDSLVSGFITKNVNLLKLSRGDMLFPVLFARSIRELDPGSVLADAFAVFYYGGGDGKAENILAGGVDAVVVWGGAEAVSAWRSRASIKARLIEYGPKMSFSFVDLASVESVGALETLCDSLAYDISLWEQSACSSPQNVFVVESGERSAEEFARMLFYALKRRESSLPPKELTLDEQIEILKFREKFFSGFIAGEGSRVFYDADSMPCSVAMSGDPRCETSVLFRNVIVKPVAGVDDFYRAIEKISFFLQAVSIAVAEKDILSVSEKLTALGVSRVLVPGRHGEPLPGAPHDAQYFLDRLVRYTAVEISGERQVPLLLSDVSEARKAAMLKSVLSDAYRRVKYYSRIISPDIFALDGAAFLEAFEKVPMLGKQEIYSNCLPDSTDIISDEGLAGAHIFASGGSTGEAKFSVYSNDELEYVTDVLADIYRVAGVRPDRRVANLFIAGGLWTSFIVANMALEKIGVTNLSIGGNTDFATMLKFFKKLRPDTIVGLPSIILKFAEFCEKERAEVRAGLVLYGGEHMRPPARAYLKKVLGAEAIVSAGYAAVDCGPVGFQCGHLSGADHHALSGYQYVELIGKDGRAVKPGEAGEIVVTNLNRSRMPVIRFRTGDLGVMRADFRCACGRANPVFELLGRCDDILVVGGANLTPRDFEDAVSRSGELSQVFQVVACTRDGFDAAEFFVELREGVEHTPRLAADIRERLMRDLKDCSFKIKTMLDSGWIKSFEIFVLPAGKIERSARTGKVAAMKDMRG